MPVQKYRHQNFKKDSLIRIAQILEILKDYPDQKLSARQVYYQFVSRDWLENTARNYKNLTNLLTDARYAGLIDWDVIEDRGRVPNRPSEWETIPDLAETAARAFRLPRWEGQENYVEVWVEKQALAGVLAPITNEFHVTLMVNKGYSSASAMKESADHMRTSVRHSKMNGGVIRTPWVLYLGDHDPSGEDMVRDVRERLEEFGVPRIEVRKIALTWDQIQEYDPPPNPAKLTDSRAAAYIEKYGDSSWELDALPPRVLNDLVRQEITQLLDQDLMDRVMHREEKLRKKFRAVIDDVENW